MTASYALTVALWLLAIVGAGSLARLAWHLLPTAWAVRAARRIRHDARAFFISPGQRVAGRDTPKPAQKAITA